MVNQIAIKDQPKYYLLVLCLHNISYHAEIIRELPKGDSLFYSYRLYQRRYKGKGAKKDEAVHRYNGVGSC